MLTDPQSSASLALLDRPSFHSSYPASSTSASSGTRRVLPSGLRSHWASTVWRLWCSGQYFQQNNCPTTRADAAALHSTSSSLRRDSLQQVTNLHACYPMFVGSQPIAGHFHRRSLRSVRPCSRRRIQPDFPGVTVTYRRIWDLHKVLITHPYGVLYVQTVQHVQTDLTPVISQYPCSQCSAGVSDAKT